MSRKSTDTRIMWIDTCRGIALLMVVIGHMGIPMVGKYFTSFHLPLFFFLSGIIFSANERFGIFVRKKVKRLLIPYLCLGIPLVITSFITRAIEGGVSVL